MVQGIIGAMRAADAASGKGQPACRLGPAPSVIQPRFVHHPDPRIEPRQVIDPTPRFESRTVYHPRPAIAPRPGPPVEVEKPRITPSPITPPWKTRPAIEAAAPKVPLKVHVVRPDIAIKGTMLDLFM